MSNARKLADNLPREGQLSGRNLIINGGMQVWQRASATTTITNSSYPTVDRFRCYTGGATYTSTRSTDVPQQNIHETDEQYAERLDSHEAPTNGRIKLNKVYSFALLRFVIRIAQRNWFRKLKK